MRVSWRATSSGGMLVMSLTFHCSGLMSGRGMGLGWPGGGS